VGEALTAPTFGVISYHHGNLEEYRGRPAAFWEMYHGKKSVGITIQRLTDSLDGGDIVAETTVNIEPYCRWRSVLVTLYESSDSLLLEAVEAIRKDDIREPNGLGELYTTPDWRITLQSFADQNLECIWRYSRKIYKSIYDICIMN
jgi:methionyl-tRNA formyltransferase